MPMASSDDKSASPKGFVKNVLTPFLFGLLTYAVPGVGYLIWGYYGRFFAALVFITAASVAFPYAVWVAGVVVIADVFMLARRRAAGGALPKRSRRLDAVGSVSLALCVGFLALVIIRPQTFAANAAACKTTFRLNPYMRKLCLIRLTPPKQAPQPPKITSPVAECELMLKDPTLIADGTERPVEFRGTCYVMRAVMSGDKGYCTFTTGDRERDCLTFLAATDGNASACELVDPSDKAACAAAIADGPEKDAIYAAFGTMGCDKLGYKGAVLKACDDDFGAFFEALRTAYHARTGK